MGEAHPDVDPPDETAGPQELGQTGRRSSFQGKSILTVARSAPTSLRVEDADSIEEEDPDLASLESGDAHRPRCGFRAECMARVRARQLIRRLKDHRNQLDDDRPRDGRVALVSKQDHCDLIVGEIEV